MIDILYPKSIRQKLDSDGYLYFPSIFSSSFYLYFGERKVSISPSLYNLGISKGESGFYDGLPPYVMGRHQLNFDTISQKSNRYDYLNLFDTVKDPPMLSSGLVERPCHHQSITGNISYTSQLDSSQFDMSKMYPFSYTSFDKTNVPWDGRKCHVMDFSGSGLGYPNQKTEDNWTSPIYISPVLWYILTYTHYYWTSDLYNPCRTWDEAESRGIIRSELIKVDSAGITLGKEYYPKRAISVDANYRAYCYGAGIADFGWLKYSPFASALPTLPLDSLEQRLRRFYDSNVAQVSSRMKDLSEIWYNLILAGSREIERLDMNNIANMLEIPGMIRIFDKIYKKFVTYKNGTKQYTNPATGAIIRKASCIYLGIHYGVKLTVMDVKEIIQKFRDNPALLSQLRRRVVSYSKTSVNGTTYSIKNCMSPRSGREVTDIRDLNRILGIELSALNLWDLVPWSFVVDWFIPISDILDEFENIARLESTYDLEYLLASMSRRESFSFNGETLTISVYDRYLTDHYPEFGFTVGAAPGLNDHVIEATALIINSV